MEQDRLIKAQKLKELDIDIFNNHFHTNAVYVNDFGSDIPSLAEIKDEHFRYRIAGRVTQINNMGGSMFIFLKRDNQLSQIFIEKKNPDFKIAKLIQLGDIIGARGPVFRTTRGAVVVYTESLVFLTKAFRGTGKVLKEDTEITNKELLYRQRYVDLISNPASIDVIKKRSNIIKNIRNFLNEREFVEVETRMLQHTNGGANARPFRTHHNALDQDLCLRIAPELDLKRLIVGGLDRIFEIGKNFRNEGTDKTHNPEFTSLEVYQAYATYDNMMTLTRELLYTLTNGKLVNDCERYSMLDAIQVYHGPFVPMNMEQMVEVFEEHVVPKLIQPTFITHFPHYTSPLARRNEKNPNYADRFELYINGMEIANGYSELNDPEEQRFNFEKQCRKGGEDAMEMDEDYIRALEYGMPPTGGLGIGIDRLVMVLLKEIDIRDVIPFPQYRKEQ